jgi:hypothetical protein
MVITITQHLLFSHRPLSHVSLGFRSRSGLAMLEKELAISVHLLLYMGTELGVLLNCYYVYLMIPCIE